MATKNHEMAEKTRNICFVASGMTKYIIVIVIARQLVTIVGVSY